MCTPLLFVNWNVVDLLKQAALTIISGGNSVANSAMQNTIYNHEETAWRESNAQLSSHPRCLDDMPHILWNKYEFEVGTNKPAKMFTPNEYGQVKYKYYLRKIFWDTVSEMIRLGWKIRDVYIIVDRLSVTNVSHKMKSNKNGGDLLIVLLRNRNLS